METIANMNLLKEAREIGGLSQWDLTRISGVGRYKIQLFEMQCADPTESELKKIKRAILNFKKTKEQQLCSMIDKVDEYEKLALGRMRKVEK